MALKLKLLSMDRLHFQEVQSKDTTALPNTLDRHLGPASRRGPQINHDFALLEQLVLVVHLHELESSAGTPAFFLGKLHIGIIYVLLHPRFAGSGSFHSVKCCF